MTDSTGSNRYIMRISRMTVDKLGVRLYDRVSAVVAELVDVGFRRVPESGGWLKRPVVPVVL